MSEQNKIQIGGNHYKDSSGECPKCGHKLEHWDWSWMSHYDQFQYCVTKYVHRHKFREGLKDLKKAQHHLAKYIEVLEENEKRMGEATAAYTNQDRKGLLTGRVIP